MSRQLPDAIELRVPLLSSSIQQRLVTNTCFSHQFTTQIPQQLSSSQGHNMQKFSHQKSTSERSQQLYISCILGRLYDGTIVLTLACRSHELKAELHRRSVRCYPVNLTANCKLASAHRHYYSRLSSWLQIMRHIHSTQQSNDVDTLCCR